MARTLSGRTAELTTPAAGDWLDVTDVSDTTQSANGSSKKITYANLTAGLGGGGGPTQPPTYQTVTAAQAQAGYQITRGSARIVVILEGANDLAQAGTFGLTTSPVEGDEIEVYRNVGGSFDWSNAATATVLGGRERYAKFLWSASAWHRIALRGRANSRRESVGRTLTIDDDASTIAITAAGTWTLPLALGQSTGWRTRLQQRGATAYVTLSVDGGLTQVGSSTLQTSYDGDELLVESIGSSQVRVSHAPVETEALATTATALTSSGIAGRPRRSTATAAVTLTLDDTAPVGTTAVLIKGAQDVTITAAANVQYYQPGDDLAQAGDTADFSCLGVMSLEVAAISGSIRQYLITGQTSLPFPDPINLSGDVIGTLAEANGGSGVTSLSTAPAITSKLPLGGGTMIGPIAMGGQNITGIGTLAATTQIPGHRTQSVAAGYTLTAADNGQMLSVTDAGTVFVPAASTLAPISGQGFALLITATGGDVLIDGPGATNVTVRNGYYGVITARNGGAIRAAEGAQAIQIS